MAKNTNRTSIKLFGGKSLEQIEKEWEPCVGGFTVRHIKTVGAVGLYRAMMGNKICFIGFSDDLDRRLQQLRSNKELRSNNHPGGRQIRKHMRELQLDILILRGIDRKDYLNKLKFALIRIHRPTWDATLPLTPKASK